MPDNHMIFWDGREDKRGSRPLCPVNGDINHGNRTRFRKAAPSKEPKLIPAVGDGLAAPPGGVAVSLETKPNTGLQPCNQNHKLPDPKFPAARKNQKRIKKFRPKKRDKVTPMEICAPAEEEDWEKEIQELTITDWDKMRVRISSSDRGSDRSILTFLVQEI
ncbi:unnamed protein product [Ophioblennius macclurei]